MSSSMATGELHLQLVVVVMVKFLVVGCNRFALFLAYRSHLYAIHSMDELGSLCGHDASNLF